MPLSMISQGDTMRIERVQGNESTRRFLENLGFVSGSSVTIVSKAKGNVIVSIKDSRVAISESMANKIFVA